MSTQTLARLVRLPADATWHRTPQRPDHLRPCETRPANWWDTGDPGNQRAKTICGACPVRAACAPKPGENAAGTIRAGIAYDDNGLPIRPCPTCGDPILRQSGSPVCVNGHGTIAQHHNTIVELRGQGHTYVAIGRAIGYGPTAVARYCRSLDPEADLHIERLPDDERTGRPHDHHDLIVAMLSDLEANHTYRDVAYVIGSTTDAVKSYWRRHQQHAARRGAPTVNRRQVCYRTRRSASRQTSRAEVAA